MIKLQWQDDQEALWEACGGHMSEMIECDTGVKTAASSIIGRDVLEQFRPDKDHWLQHVVALGDYETWGENRNADAYTKEANSRCHPTFVKYGHFFREHKHTDPSLKIGDIKYSAYNPEMKRTELLIWGNKKLAAAEYEDAKAGKAHTYSMACKVAFDVCNICGHEAKNPKVWCGHMKTARGKYVPSHRKYAFVYNPNPRFFDISDVGYPADRTAYGLRRMFGEEDGVKAASADRFVISGAAWAELEGVSVPASMLEGTEKLAAAPQPIARLAAYESEIVNGFVNTTKTAAAAIKAAMTCPRMDALEDAAMESLRSVAPPTLFRHLAERKIVLPVPEFASFLTGRSPRTTERDPAVQDACDLLKGGVFGRVAEAGVPADVSHLFEAGGHNAARMGSSYNDAFDTAIDKAEDAFGLDNPRRSAVLIIKSAFANTTLEPRAESVVGFSADKLASAYVQYVTQAVEDINNLTDGVGDIGLGLLVGSIYENGGLSV